MVFKDDVETLVEGDMFAVIYLNSDISKDMTRTRSLNEIKDIFKELSEIKELSRVNIYTYYPSRYASRQRELFGIVMSRETMDKINWDTLSIDDIESVADEYFEDLKFLEP